MKSKLEKILAQCSFLSDEQVSTIRNNEKLFDTIPPSKGFLKRLSENAMSFDEKLDLLNYHKKILVGLPSSALASIFKGSLEKTIKRILSVPELKALGVEGQAIGLALQYGDVNEKIWGREELEKWRI